MDRRYNSELVGTVKEFLHREVGEPEEDAEIDAVTLLDLIFADQGIGAFGRLVENENYFVLIYDEEGNENDDANKWELVTLRNRQTKEFESDTLEGLIAKSEESLD